MAVKILIFLLPALVSAKIKVNIETGRTQEDSFVEAIGSTIDIISDEERETFKINDYQLKDAMEKWWGDRPDDVFVKSPTKWDDLYTRYSWAQVQRTLRPVSAKVLRLTKKQEVITKKTFCNHSKKNKASYSGSIKQERETTASTTWTNSHSFSVNQKIEYSVGLSEVLSAGGSTSFGFTGSWGSGTTKSETMMVGSGIGVKVDLEPGQQVQSVLSASLGTLEIEVQYEATLSGRVTVNYSNKHNGHYFWAPDVNAVLNAAGLPTRLMSTEIIKVGFYADEQVTNHDFGSCVKQSYY
ncbi:U-megalopygitoxin(8)-Mc8-like [Choristoneura fumiferana]|uniref:U-megalopygitoxin(8)-Mc8-like n=1 Tax=Choristoneura fumiferana TaxID=7141 RepID=UPI003D15D645